MAPQVNMLVTDPIEIDVFAQVLRESTTRFAIDYCPNISATELERIIHHYDGVVLRSRTKLPRTILERSHLHYIGRAGNGYDNIDVAAAQELGIHVDTCPEGSTQSVVELVFGLFIGLARNIVPAHTALIQGRWEKENNLGHELAGKTLGIIGLGVIGSEIALRSHSFDMQLIAHDPGKTSPHATALGVSLVSLDELLLRSDYLTINVRLTQDTYSLIGRREIALVKEGVYVVNTAREQVIDMPALVDAIKGGKVAGYATDVFETEPPAYAHPLLELARDGYPVIVTPHLGAQATEAQRRIAENLGRKTATFFDALAERHKRKKRKWGERLSMTQPGLVAAGVLVAFLGIAYAISDPHRCDQEGWDVNYLLPDVMVRTCPHRSVPGNIPYLFQKKERR